MQNPPYLSPQLRGFIEEARRLAEISKQREQGKAAPTVQAPAKAA